MKLKKISVLTLLAGGLFFASTPAVFAADPAPDSCDVTVSSDGTETACAIPSDTQVDPVGGCWVDDQGNDICAKSGIIQDSPNDTDPVLVCGTETTDGVACTNPMYNTMEDSDVDLLAADGMTLTSSSTGLLTGLGVISSLIGALVIALLTQKRRNSI